MSSLREEQKFKNKQHFHFQNVPSHISVSICTCIRRHTHKHTHRMVQRPISGRLLDPLPAPRPLLTHAVWLTLGFSTAMREVVTQLTLYS